MDYIKNAVKLRRELHQIPELGWGEFCTTAKFWRQSNRLVGRRLSALSRSVSMLSWAGRKILWKKQKEGTGRRCRPDAH